MDREESSPRREAGGPGLPSVREGAPRGETQRGWQLRVSEGGAGLSEGKRAGWLATSERDGALRRKARLAARYLRSGEGPL